MRMTMRRVPFVLALVTACSADPPVRFTALDASAADASDAAADAATDAKPTDGPDFTDVAPLVRDAPDVGLAPDAACTAAGVMATLERLPVDIIWVVDNSSSMAPAIDQVIVGLNRFATLVGTRGLDYRVVMLSLRNTTRSVTVMGTARYTVCIPMPLAGDTACGNGERFFHSSIDVRSTQPLDQLLGTLGQTRGYSAGEQRGGEAWRQFLRREATKTIVVVTDDESRLTPDDFDHFAGGPNPNSSSLILPAGLLDESWDGLFDGYTFSGLYGWGDEASPGTRCQYPNGSQPSSAGPSYTTLVARTHGVRARICDGASAWGPFFEGVASSVARAARIACDLAIPTPPPGQELDVGRINVTITGPSGRTLVGKVRDASACSGTGGWYYDSDVTPTRVLLCPASCERAQTELATGTAGVEVQFGCVTIPG